METPRTTLDDLRCIAAAICAPWNSRRCLALAGRVATREDIETTNRILLGRSIDEAILAELHRIHGLGGDLDQEFPWLGRGTTLLGCMCRNIWRAPRSLEFLLREGAGGAELHSIELKLRWLLEQAGEFENIAEVISLVTEEAARRNIAKASR